MAYTKRNFRKKSRSNRRKRTSVKRGGKKYSMGGKKCSMGGKKCSMGGKKYSRGRGKKRARRGGAEGDVTVIPFNDPNIPEQVRTWSLGLATPTNFVRVLFTAIEDGDVNVVSLNKEANEESTIITRAVYSRDSSLAREMLQRNEDCEITDTITKEKWMVKFLSFPSGPIRPESFPQYLWFYQV